MANMQTKRVRFRRVVLTFLTHVGLLSPISNNENDNGTSPHRIAVAPLWMTVIDDINYDLSRIKKKSTMHRCSPTHARIQVAELLDMHSKHLTGGSFNDTDRDKQVRALKLHLAPDIS